MKNFELISFSTADELARAAAAAWLDAVEAAQRLGQRHCVALSGGRIARDFFSAGAALARARRLTLQGVEFFWADERCLPPDDPESNFRLANDLLFAPLKIPERQVHRIRGEEPPDAAATQAEEEIRRVAPGGDSDQPVLDLVLLGMGPDGHVASLFPNEPEPVRNSPAVYRAVRNSPKPPPDRVTLGYPALAAAREVWALVSGPGKEAALRDSLGSQGSTSLARVIRSRARTRIFTDIG